VDDGTLLAAAEQLESLKCKWDGDGDVLSYPVTKHCERVVSRTALHRILLDQIARFHTPVDMDLLPFQAGADASSG